MRLGSELPQRSHISGTNPIGWRDGRKEVRPRGYDTGLGAPHHIMMEERSSLTVSGVSDVERFDENEIVMSTSKGTLVVTGENLHIEKLSLDGGDLKVEGDIDALTYEESRRERSGGLLARLLR